MKSILISQRTIVTLLAAIVCVFTFHSPSEAQNEITGPWLWMIVPIQQGSGGAESTNVDSLAVASGGTVTEADVAANGATEGDIVGNYAWTLGVLNNTGDIEQLLYEIGMTENRYIDNASSYALITLVSEMDQPGVTMHTGSDDSIKVWLNGENVFTNAVNRGRYRWQDNFQVNLKKGDNLLLVKVSELGGGWGMHVGIGADVTLKVPTRLGTPTEPVETPIEPVLTEDGLVLHLSFDNNTIQGNTVQDQSGAGNHGTIYGGAQTVTGKHGEALAFDGVDDYVEVPLTDSITFSTDDSFTVQAWIKTDDQPRLNDIIIGNYRDYTPTHWSLSIHGDSQEHRGKAAFRVGEDAGTGAGIRTSNFMNDGEWHLLTGVRDQNTKKIRFYVDGELIGETDDTSIDPNSRQSIWIGEHLYRYYKGLIDEVKVWNRALTAEELGQTKDTILFVDATVSLSPAPSEPPRVGEQLILNLNVAGGEHIAGYQATIQFDETVLRYVSSANADFLQPDIYIATPIVNGNTVTIAATSLVREASGDGTLATLTFEIAGQKASTLTLTEVLFSDGQGMLTRPQVESTELIITAYLKEDVNRDGVVDIQDMMLVDADLTKIGEYATDVNEDGAVNIADLVLVAAAQSSNTTAAVPALHQAKAYTLSRSDVEMWLQEAKQLNLTDPKSLRGLRFLEQLLLAIAPEKTALLANYPNPFNPETWIPYQLAKPAKVKLTIYAADGKLIRTLTLGHQAAGVYHNRSRAAYWNGKNGAGESVASGVYLYTLIAGDFTATRKMLILK